MRFPTACFRDGFGAILPERHLATDRSERASQHFPIIGAVIHDERPNGVARCEPHRARSSIGAFSHRRGKGQIKEESRPNAAFGLKFKFAAEQLDLALSDGEAKSRAALVPRAAALMEGFENVRLFTFRNSQPGVEHLEKPAAACNRIQTETHFACVREFDRVADEIDEHLTQLSFISADGALQMPGNVETERDSLLRTQ